MPYTFTKKERLSSFKEIDLLLKKGDSFYNPPFKLIFFCSNKYSSSTLNDTQTTPISPAVSIMISVPKRNFKRAVKRNLLKRRIREAYRLNKNEFIDKINALNFKYPDNKFKVNFLVIYNSKEVLSYGQIEKSLKEILDKLLVKIAYKMSSKEIHKKTEEVPKLLVNTEKNLKDSQKHSKNLFVILLSFPIILYQILISPLKPASCRFTPTCSQYAIEALKKYGPFKGIYLAIRRVLRCHPWGGSGYDPV